MLNVVVLIGRLVRDPELRYTPSGVAVGGFTLAVDRPFTNQQGEREADFIDVVVWRKLAETCANHLSKGRLVAVRGRLQVRSYETQDGQRRRVAEVVADDVRFLDRAPGADRGTTADTQAGEELADFGDVTGLPDDDIPF
ncbi:MULTISPECIES: single-stranded DNA-binding protein [Thermaerobacter]|uniref:Single-stranded DNA-binding protein n=1 Tax=Thermaerobacter composti TaxID=554949 RepID=A0ABZ0QNN0_9FIRM|nr:MULTISPECIES: single-stranded DNA-binding protein [Thermaerobacter]PZN09361.1 MAG: single-stranded DNA-binding protein [Bacillota bacterium]QBS37080.1 single-stranded DNA-binding protein [Thermaerobacter sp. FW80]WPD19095.1 single-stranded DNA-binding protein [Thermaerobacter composti]